ncbi:hypothetical protein [Mangrovimonas sp. TPBH4]|uniref:hypothetical protein n=1 Tax=Mangrovimonas sp. TPBH4 TaxID=1645914 RepID=UPI0006B58AA6|nr:hypothetical protein [Mangrovimonas sp. TPBH4]
MRSILGEDVIVKDAIVFVIGANLCYTLSWLLEMVYQGFHDGVKYSSHRVRWALFILGSMFSMVWTNYYFVIGFDVLFAY